MKLVWLNVSNWLLHGLHLGVLGANLFGWVYRPLWPWHRLCVGVTLMSWLGLGLVVGRPGYCVLTDWHWRVRAALGERNLPDTYLAFLMDRAGISVGRARLSVIVSLVFTAICAIALFEWWLERRA